MDSPDVKKPRLSICRDEDNEGDTSESEISEPPTPPSPPSPRAGSSRSSPPIPDFIRILQAKSVVPSEGEEMGPKYDPTEEGALILHQHEQIDKRFSRFVNPDGVVPVVLDPVLGSLLREEQGEGLQFLFDCFVRKEGCILAHSMGAGKTLTCIALIHVLLEQRPGSTRKSTPGIRNAVIVVPKSMVTGWADEFAEWTEKKAYCKYQPKIAFVKFRDANEDQKIIEDFLSPDSPEKVLILSYERFIKFQHLFESVEEEEDERLGDSDRMLDLIIFDEAHRLKNVNTKQSFIAGTALSKMKILITGTPVQNTLEQLFRLVDIAQPGVLQKGTNCNEEEFRKKYTIPFSHLVLTRNQFKVTPEDLRKLSLLKSIINPIMHIRQNPVQVPKHEMLICLELEPIQMAMYKRVSKWCLDGQQFNSNRKNYWYSHINLLRTICSHPRLALRQVRKSNSYTKGYYKELNKIYKAFEDYANKYNNPGFDGLHSQKMKFIYALVKQLQLKYDTERLLDKTKTPEDKEKIVIVSNYTEVLDMVEKLIVAGDPSIKCHKLYGKTTIAKRKSNIAEFNNKAQDYTVFLLSLKAGGTGITLIGANHLVLLDPDWNPSNDEQAMARIWRQGQTRRCYIYRLICTGTIEEVILKRQITKKELERYITEDDFSQFNTLPEKARELVTLIQDTSSSVHDAMHCNKEACRDLQALLFTAQSEALSSEATNGNSHHHHHEEIPHSSTASFGDYAIEAHSPVQRDDQEDKDNELLDAEVESDISSLAGWDHFSRIEHLPAGEQEIPILLRLWKLQNEGIPVGIKFVFHKKTNPITPEQARVKDGNSLLEYLVPTTLTNLTMI